MANYELGKIGLNARGEYNAATTYEHLDVVSFEGSSYIALKTTIGHEPDNVEYWMLLAQGNLEKTPWVELTPLVGVTPGDYGSGKLRYRRVADHVYIEGSVNVQPGSSTINLATIPEGFRPVDTTPIKITACSGSRIARVTVYPDGTLRLSWVKNLSDGDSYTSEAIWVDCSIDYWMTSVETNAE